MRHLMHILATDNGDLVIMFLCIYSFIHLFMYLFIYLFISCFIYYFVVATAVV